MKATEAREIVDNCTVRVEHTLNTEIFTKIKEQAEAGKAEYFYDIKSCGILESLPPLTTLQRRLHGRLQELGYNVEYTKYGSYVPRGLADDYDGTGPIYINCGLLIRW